MPVGPDAIPQGGVHDITVDQGATWRRLVSLREPDESTPIDLTGWFARAQIRLSVDGDVVAEMAVEIDEEAGDIALSMASTVTAAIRRDGMWSLELYNDEEPPGVVQVVSVSKVRVRRDVTMPGGDPTVPPGPTSAAVVSVNGRTGIVSGLAEADDLDGLNFPRGEMDVDEKTDVQATTAAAATIVVPDGAGTRNLSVTAPVGTRPYYVVLSGHASHSVAGDSVKITLYEDGVAIDEFYVSSVLASGFTPFHRERRRDPAAAPKEYVVGFGRVQVGTATLQCTALRPLTLLVIER